jgi:LPXTG-motif cell wall-anchored protein
MSNKINMKSKKMKLRIPLAAAGVLGLGLGASAMVAPGAASAASPTTYQANLQPIPLNTPDGAASGTLTVVLNGNQAQITENVTGLGSTLPTDPTTLSSLGVPAAFAGKPFPHVQHIHGPDAALGAGGMGQCPTAAADANHDGFLTTGEAGSAYGPILTTLSVDPGGTGNESSPDATNVAIAPGGGSFTYNRTITLDQATLSALQSNQAVIVVHGLNPANAPAASLTTQNSVGLTLPGASKPVAAVATAPALCGVLTASQMSAVPSGGVHTGGGSTGNVQDLSLFVLGGALLLGGGGIVAARKVRSARAQS